MAKDSAIEWTDGTWNPWRGCQKVSPGCDNCYMFPGQKRYGNDPSTVVRAAKATFNAPLKYKGPMKVFTCSWSDFFIKEADEWRDDAWKIIKATPHLTYLILTKRPELIADRLPDDWGAGYQNVWLGVTAENQEQAAARIPLLLETPAAKRFVSIEPMLEGVEVYYWLPFLDWVVLGGESGPGARPVHPSWVRSVKDDCKAADVPFFFKQMKVGGKMVKLPELDGKEHKEVPA